MSEKRDVRRLAEQIDAQDRAIKGLSATRQAERSQLSIDGADYDLSLIGAEALEAALASIKNGLDLEEQQAIVTELDVTQGFLQEELWEAEDLRGLDRMDVGDAFGYLAASHDRLDVVEKDFFGLEDRLLETEIELSETSARLDASELVLSERFAEAEVELTEANESQSRLQDEITSFEESLVDLDTKTTASQDELHTQLEDLETLANQTSEAVQSGQSELQDQLEVVGEQLTNIESDAAITKTDFFEQLGQVSEHVVQVETDSQAGQAALEGQVQDVDVKATEALALAPLTVDKLLAVTSVILEAFIKSAHIQDLDVSKLVVTGTGTLDEAVINELFAQVVKARVVEITDELLAEDGTFTGRLTADHLDVTTLFGSRIDGLKISGGEFVQWATSDPLPIYPTPSYEVVPADFMGGAPDAVRVGVLDVNEKETGSNSVRVWRTGAGSVSAVWLNQGVVAGTSNAMRYARFRMKSTTALTDVHVTTLTGSEAAANIPANTWVTLEAEIPPGASLPWVHVGGVTESTGTTSIYIDTLTVLSAALEGAHVRISRNNDGVPGVFIRNAQGDLLAEFTPNGLRSVNPATGEWVRLRNGGIDFADGSVLSPNPIGSVTQFAGITAPSGWLLCRGQAISRTTYSGLFDVIGTTYGVGNGSTTFNVPNLMGRVPVGVSTSDSDFTLGKTGGAKTHTLTVAQLPSHSHSGSSNSTGAHTHTLSVNSGGAHTHTGTAASAGSHTHTPTLGSAGAHTHSVGGTGFDFLRGQTGSAYNLARRTVNRSSGDQVAYTTTTSSELASSAATNSSGAHTHSLSLSSTGAHTHTVSTVSAGAHTHTGTASSAGAHSHTITIGNAGSGSAHNILQPYLGLNHIIKY